MSGGWWSWSQAVRRRMGRWGNSRRGGWRVNARPEERLARLERANWRLAWVFTALLVIAPVVIIVTADVIGERLAAAECAAP